jgi:hypothetical protein
VSTVVRRGAGLGALVAVVVGGLAGCSLFGDDEHKSDSTSVFDIKVGQCFLALPAKDIQKDLTELPRVDCDKPHQQESYALPTYVDPGTTTTPKVFPGDAALKSFADGTCAQEFQGYVGVDYRDSSLFFTYLAPSARSWEQDEDRTVICFVTTTGQTLTASVADSGM